MSDVGQTFKDYRLNRKAFVRISQTVSEKQVSGVEIVLGLKWLKMKRNLELLISRTKWELRASRPTYIFIPSLEYRGNVLESMITGGNLEGCEERGLLQKNGARKSPKVTNKVMKLRS